MRRSRARQIVGWGALVALVMSLAVIVPAAADPDAPPTVAMVKDIRPGPTSSGPRNFVALGDTVLFAADDGTHGIELWGTDGTAAGTRLVKDINPTDGPAGHSHPALSSAGVLNGVLYFSAKDSFGNAELWRTDGTGGGTYLVKEINTRTNGAFGEASSPASMIVYKNSIFFTADDGTECGLWSTDGTSDNTVLVFGFSYAFMGAPCNSAPNGPRPGHLTVDGDFLYFGADSSSQLWRSDGTTAGTRAVSGSTSEIGGKPRQMTGFDGEVYFTYEGLDHGLELWRTRTVGDDQTIELVADLRTGVPSSTPQYLTVLGSRLLFTANVSGLGGGGTLWVLDAGGTPRQLTVTGGEPSALTVFGGLVYFRTIDGVDNAALWSTDGTQAGTTRVLEFPAGTLDPDHFMVAGQRLYFTTSVPYAATTQVKSLWMLRDNHGAVKISDNYPGGGSLTDAHSTAVGDVLYLAASSSAAGNELWSVGGAPPGPGTPSAACLAAQAAETSAQAAVKAAQSAVATAQDDVTTTRAAVAAQHTALVKAKAQLKKAKKAKRVKKIKRARKKVARAKARLKAARNAASTKQGLLTGASSELVTKQSTLSRATGARVNAC